MMMKKKKKKKKKKGHFGKSGLSKDPEDGLLHLFINSMDSLSLFLHIRWTGRSNSSSGSETEIGSRSNDAMQIIISPLKNRQ